MDSQCEGETAVYNDPDQERLGACGTYIIDHGRTTKIHAHLRQTYGGGVFFLMLAGLLAGLLACTMTARMGRRGTLFFSSYFSEGVMSEYLYLSVIVLMCYCQKTWPDPSEGLMHMTKERCIVVTNLNDFFLVWVLYVLSILR